jgi:hypothetical protein
LRVLRLWRNSPLGRTAAHIAAVRAAACRRVAPLDSHCERERLAFPRNGAKRHRRPRRATPTWTPTAAELQACGGRQRDACWRHVGCLLTCLDSIGCSMPLDTEDIVTKVRFIHSHTASGYRKNRSFSVPEYSFNVTNGSTRSVPVSDGQQLFILLFSLSMGSR